MFFTMITGCNLHVSLFLLGNKLRLRVNISKLNVFLYDGSYEFFVRQSLREC